MKLVIASDHAGFEYKRRIGEWLRDEGHQVDDLGTGSPEPVDYPDFIRPAALAVAEGRAERGIVLGGSGNGEAIVANRIRGIRCAVCWNNESARLSREHNDANMISLGQRLISWDVAKVIVEIFLTACFQDGRHRRRIEKIDG